MTGELPRSGVMTSQLDGSPLSVIDKPGAFGLGKALGGLPGLKAHDGLVAIDGHDNRVNRRPCRIVSRRYLNVEGHLVSHAFPEAQHGHRRRKNGRRMGPHSTVGRPCSSPLRRGRTERHGHTR